MGAEQDDFKEPLKTLGQLLAEDLRRLDPTPDELQAAAAWATTHDPSAGFQNELHGLLRELGIVDGDL